MRKGVTTLPEERRPDLVAMQMSVLATLPPPVPRSVLETMDLALGDGAVPVYQQPRGLPRVPMRTARALLAEAVPETIAKAGVPRWMVLFAGYGWHVLNGLGFGVTYTLLFGHGTWALAVGAGFGGRCTERESTDACSACAGEVEQMRGWSWITLVLGAWLVVAPWVLGYRGTAATNDVILGLAVGVAAIILLATAARGWA